jgi:hypothetical protein
MLQTPPNQENWEVEDLDLRPCNEDEEFFQGILTQRIWKRQSVSFWMASMNINTMALTTCSGD